MAFDARMPTRASFVGIKDFILIFGFVFRSCCSFSLTGYRSRGAGGRRSPRWSAIFLPSSESLVASCPLMVLLGVTSHCGAVRPLMLFCSVVIFRYCFSCCFVWRAACTGRGHCEVCLLPRVEIYISNQFCAGRYSANVANS